MLVVVTCKKGAPEFLLLILHCKMCAGLSLRRLQGTGCGRVGVGAVASNVPRLAAAVALGGSAGVLWVTAASRCLH